MRCFAWPCVAAAVAAVACAKPAQSADEEYFENANRVLGSPSDVTLREQAASGCRVRNWDDDHLWVVGTGKRRWEQVRSEPFDDPTTTAFHDDLIEPLAERFHADSAIGVGGSTIILHDYRLGDPLILGICAMLRDHELAERVVVRFENLVVIFDQA